MDIVSLVIGTSGLLTMAEAACNVVRTINDAQALPKDMSDLLAQVSLESTKVRVWSLEASISVPSGRMGGQNNRGADARLYDSYVDLVQQCASGVGTALKDVNEIAAKYLAPSSDTIPNALLGRDSAVESGIQDVVSMLLSATTPASRLALKTRIQSKQRESYLKSWSLRKRINAVSKPWGQSDMDTLRARLRQMKYWNDQIFFILLPREGAIVRSCVGASVAADINNKGVLEGVQRAAQGKDGEMAKSTALAVQVMDQETQLCQGCDSYTIRIVDLEMHDGDLGSSGMLRCSKSIQHGSTSLDEDCMVHVEWLDYSGLSHEQEIIARGRIHALCHLLDAEKPNMLQTLQFVGHVNNIEDRQIGILSRKQDSAERLVSLRQILKASAEKLRGNMSFPKPSLGERFYLALRLCRAFMELHKAHWLHKGFNSACLLLSPVSSSVRVETAVISGFQYARPGGNQQVSLPLNEDILGDRMWYLHPEIRKKMNEDCGSSRMYTKYMARHDIYSLGVVLLEIGLWTPIEKVADPKKDSPDGFFNSVRSRARNNLPYYMGVKYATVVDRCLTGPQINLDIAAELGQDMRLAEQRAAEIESMFNDILRPLEDFQNYETQYFDE